MMNRVLVVRRANGRITSFLDALASFFEGVSRRLEQKCLDEIVQITIQYRVDIAGFEFRS